MPAVLLTWNPGPDDGHRWNPEQWAATVVAACRAGDGFATTWGVGQHVHGIGPGQVAYLYRQGVHGRGIVAGGAITSDPWRGPHPQRPGWTRNHVDVRWHQAVSLDDAVRVADLEQAVPGFGWRQVYGSGRRVPAPAAEQLARAWAERVADVG